MRDPIAQSLSIRVATLAIDHSATRHQNVDKRVHCRATEVEFHLAVSSNIGRRSMWVVPDVRVNWLGSNELHLQNAKNPKDSPRSYLSDSGIYDPVQYLKENGKHAIKHAHSDGTGKEFKFVDSSQGVNEASSTEFENQFYIHIPKAKK